MYKEKYVKYKFKYLALKSQLDSYPNIIQDGGAIIKIAIVTPSDMTEILSIIKSNENIAQNINSHIEKDGQILGIEHRQTHSEIVIYLTLGNMININLKTDSIIYNSLLEIYNKSPKKYIENYEPEPAEAAPKSLAGKSRPPWFRPQKADN